MNSAKKVKKIFTKSIPRYYLRSRKVHAPIFVRPVRPKQDQETQAELSDEDREALFAEIPFHFLSSPESDTEVEEHLNPSPSSSYPIPSSKQFPKTSRRSTAFCTPTQGQVADFDPQDISVDSDDESFLRPSDSEEELRDTHTPRTCPERSYQFSPYYIEHSKEESSDSDSDDTPDQSPNRRNNAVQLLPQVINSPSDLIKLVPQRAFREESVSSETSVDSSSCEEENEELTHQLSVADEHNFYDPREAVQELTMDRSILEEHQRVLSTLAKGIANKDVRIDKFRGYENEDITCWFRKLELELEAKKIPTTDLLQLLKLSTIWVDQPRHSYLNYLKKKRTTMPD